MIRLGVVCSSGGAVIGAALRLLKACDYDLHMAVVTDRPCGAEALCTELAVPWKRIEQPLRDHFSAQAADWLLDEQRVDWTSLFFSRLVSRELFSRAPCVNFHPSLLPAFRGFGALKGVIGSGVRFVGATAHSVDESTDSGPILAQVMAPVPATVSLAELERISFAQKLYLLLVMCEQAELGELSASFPSGRLVSGLPVLAWANPALRDKRLADAFDQFLVSEKITWQR